MKSIRDAGATLEWTHPEVQKRAYLLNAGTETVANLAWQKQEGSLALAETADGSWTFKRVGYLNPHVLIRDAQTGGRAGRFDASATGSGMLELPDGRHFKWSSNLWRAEWGWRTTSGEEIMRFHRSFDVIEKREGNVQIKHPDLAGAHLPLLTILGFYLIILVAETHDPQYSY